MADGVFVLRQDGGLVEMSGRMFEAEDHLQSLIARYPGLLAGDQIDPAAPRRWILVKREVDLPSEDGGAARWSVDHLFLHQDGIPTIVEVKRSSDTRIRREVVGQMLEYAANAVEHWPLEFIQTAFAATCLEAERQPDVVLAYVLEPGADVQGYWARVKHNLEDGNLRLLFVADDVPSELRRIVEFLNAHMERVEVLAVEIKQFGGQGMTTLVSRVIGQTEEARRKKPAGARERREWDEATFFPALEASRGAAEAAVARRILEWAKPLVSRVDWGSGKKDGSFIPILSNGDDEYYPIVVYTYGRVEVQFQYLVTRPPFHDEAKRRELLRRLNEIDGVNLPADAITRRPSIQLSLLTDDSRLAKFLSVLEWFKSQIGAAP